jgi:hypothetical protein
MIFKLIKRWRPQDNHTPAPPRREREDTTSMAELVRLLQREQEPAK